MVVKGGRVAARVKLGAAEIHLAADKIHSARRGDSLGPQRRFLVLLADLGIFVTN